MAKSDPDIIKRAIIKAGIILFMALTASIILGIVISSLNNMKNIEELLESKRPSLPSKVFDRNGNEITEFYSDEKRELVNLDLIPEYLVQALIAWEDASFYQHHGFNPLAIMRAAFNNLRGFPISGASTITQQLANVLFFNKEFTIERKIKELWVAFQLEKKYTKNEILTLYLNHVHLGAGLNGVQAASQFYFKKNVQNISYAEAASLITLISNPTLYSFIKFPQNHKAKQKEVMNKMVRNGIISDLDSEKSFNDFWLNWQEREDSARGAFFNRNDKAPFFSDWILNILEEKLPKGINVFKDGLKIYTTLDLEHQEYAQKLMDAVLEKQQKIYEEYSKRNYNIIHNQFMDALSLMGLTYSLENIQIGVSRIKSQGKVKYRKEINAPLNLTSQIFNIDSLLSVTENYFNQKEKSANELMTQVQGAFIVIENQTGQILTMIGGKVFDPNHRFNFAMQSRRQPGSTFKPLIYSAALDSQMFTAATMINDAETVFTFDSDDPDDWYTPANYGGYYHGLVNFRKALKSSLNIPACRIFYEIGKNNEYRVPIDWAAKLLDLNAQEDIDSRFSKEISTVLGTGSVSPIEMVKAFSVFANQGQRRYPNSIIKVVDRDGNVIYSPWKELEKYYRDNRNRLQVINDNNAFIMTDILKGTVHDTDGYLYPHKEKMLENGKVFPDVEMAAKTGTSQNFGDTWLIGYSPEITTGAWVGFKEYGVTLGFNQSAVQVLGPTWLEFMRKSHIGKEELRFKKPSGLRVVEICRKSGKRPSPHCSDYDVYYEYFIPGTTPDEETQCHVCQYEQEKNEESMNNFTQIFESSQINGFDDQIFGDDVIVDPTLLIRDNSDVTLDKNILDINLFDDDLSFNFDDEVIVDDRVSDETTDSHSVKPVNKTETNNTNENTTDKTSSEPVAQAITQPDTTSD
ncbi:MAG: transglycosylase domain-containing protein [Spirochaetes bacterium]|nr:transglycosylase domain-containing protein [Spirochaetota bacterium]